MNQYKDAIIYVVLTAVAFVFIDNIGSKISPLFLLFIISIIATIWFNAINLGQLKATYNKCSKNIDLFGYVTLFSGINWLCSVYAPSRSDSFIYLLVICITLAICSCSNQFLLKKSKFAIISAILLVFCLIYIYFFYKPPANRSVVLGLILGIIAGITAYCYGVVTNKFQHKCQLSSTQILAIRFWPLNFVLGTIVEYKHLDAHFTLSNFLIVIFIAFAALITPAYFCQQAIKKIGAARASIIFATTPMCVLIFYGVFDHIFELSNVMICVVITLALVLQYIKREW